MEPTDAFKRLPRWAQQEIEKLRADNAGLEIAAAVAIGTEETRVEVNPYSHMMGRTHRCFIPERETIRFHFGERQFVDVRLEGDVVAIMGDNAISISPRAANVIWIKPERD